VPLLAPLTPEERATFIVVALSQKALRRLVGHLGTAPPGVHLNALAVWDLAWSLVDFYDKDAEVVAGVDRVLRKELGESPLASAVAAAGGAAAVSALLLEAPDPARDLAWAILSSGNGDVGPLASTLVQTIIAEFDEADARAKEAEAAEPEAAEPVDDELKRLASEKAKEAARALSARARALKRLGGVKDRLVELERGLAEARQELRDAETARGRLEDERSRLVEERDALRARVRSGTAAQVTQLTEDLEAAQRRARALEADLDEARDAEASLGARIRTLEAERTTRAAAGRDDDEARAPSPGGAAWSLPIFTDEFYASIRRWDPKVVRNAFEKIYRLAEDWRHPSLRAIPLEGLPDHYRLRVATDVRLIYRPLDGNRVEILSLIDREDLQRYIRQAKTR